MREGLTITVFNGIVAVCFRKSVIDSMRRDGRAVDGAGLENQ